MLAVAAGVAAASASAKPSSFVQLKVCAYYTVNDTTPTANVKVLAPGAAGLHGSFVLKGNAGNTVTHFKVRANGTAFTSFAVTSPGGERVTVTLGSKSRVLAISLPAGTNVKQQKGCTPR
jgi:hypothetical protein